MDDYYLKGIRLEFHLLGKWLQVEGDDLWYSTFVITLRLITKNSDSGGKWKDRNVEESKQIKVNRER